MNKSRNNATKKHKKDFHQYNSSSGRFVQRLSTCSQHKNKVATPDEEFSSLTPLQRKLRDPNILPGDDYDVDLALETFFRSISHAKQSAEYNGYIEPTRGPGSLKHMYMARKEAIRNLPTAHIMFERVPENIRKILPEFDFREKNKNKSEPNKAVVVKHESTPNDNNADESFFNTLDEWLREALGRKHSVNLRQIGAFILMAETVTSDRHAAMEIAVTGDFLREFCDCGTQQNARRFMLTAERIGLVKLIDDDYAAENNVHQCDPKVCIEDDPVMAPHWDPTPWQAYRESYRNNQRNRHPLTYARVFAYNRALGRGIKEVLRRMGLYDEIYRERYGEKTNPNESVPKKLKSLLDKDLKSLGKTPCTDETLLEETYRKIRIGTGLRITKAVTDEQVQKMILAKYPIVAELLYREIPAINARLDAERGCEALRASAHIRVRRSRCYITKIGLRMTSPLCHMRSEEHDMRRIEERREEIRNLLDEYDGDPIVAAANATHRFDALYMLSHKDAPVPPLQTLDRLAYRVKHEGAEQSLVERYLTGDGAVYHTDVKGSILQVLRFMNKGVFDGDAIDPYARYATGRDAFDPNTTPLLTPGPDGVQEDTWMIHDEKYRRRQQTNRRDKDEEDDDERRLDSSSLNNDYDCPPPRCGWDHPQLWNLAEFRRAVKSLYMYLAFDSSSSSALNHLTHYEYTRETKSSSSSDKPSNKEHFRIDLLERFFHHGYTRQDAIEVLRKAHHALQRHLGRNINTVVFPVESWLYAHAQNEMFAKHATPLHVVYDSFYGLNLQEDEKTTTQNLHHIIIDSHKKMKSLLGTTIEYKDIDAYMRTFKKQHTTTKTSTQTTLTSTLSQNFSTFKNFNQQNIKNQQKNQHHIISNQKTSITITTYTTTTTITTTTANNNNKSINASSTTNIINNNPFVQLFNSEKLTNGVIQGGISMSEGIKDDPGEQKRRSSDESGGVGNEESQDLW